MGYCRVRVYFAMFLTLIFQCLLDCVGEKESVHLMLGVCVCICQEEPHRFEAEIAKDVICCAGIRGQTPCLICFFSQQEQNVDPHVCVHS